MNMLCRVPLDVSRFYALLFQARRFINVFPIKAYVKHGIPGVGPFLTPGALFEQNW